MRPQFSFRAQAADGALPAHLRIGDRLVEDQADDERKTAVDRISWISQGGRTLKDKSGAKLTRRGDWIMVKVHTNELDDRGRLASILCWGQTRGRDLETFGNAALSGLDDFAKQIGRTIRTDQFVLLEQAFRDEKARSRKLGVVIILAGVVAAVAALEVRLQNSDASKATEQGSSSTNYIHEE